MPRRESEADYVFLAVATVSALRNVRPLDNVRAMQVCWQGDATPSMGQIWVARYAREVGNNNVKTAPHWA